MTILVTGGAGYIGSHMVHALAESGQSVMVIDNLSTGFASALPKSARLVQGDIGDAALLGQVLAGQAIELIIHFAGSIIVPESVRDPLSYYLNNTVKSRELIAQAVRAGVKRFIFSSTAAVYGMTGNEPVGEEAPLKPLSPYGRSKLMTEMMLADVAAAHDLRYVALRYFNVAGADPKGRTGQSTAGATHLIKVACEAALGKRPKLEVYGTDYPTKDGSCVRDYIHVSDLVAAHEAAARHLSGGGESQIFNCGYGHGYSVLEVIEAVRRVSGRDFKVTIGPRRPGDPAAIVADASLIRKKLGWQPKLDDLERICETALRWEEKLG